MPALPPFRHLLLALVAVAIWGSNFVAIKLALADLPPLLLCAVRFVFVSFPLVLLLPRPAVTWGQLLTYGGTMFAAQFAFMFLGMKLGMSAGLASLLLQLQVFGMLTSALWLGESLPGWKLRAAALVLAGLVLCVLGPRVHARLRPVTPLAARANPWAVTARTPHRAPRR